MRNIGKFTFVTNRLGHVQGLCARNETKDVYVICRTLSSMITVSGLLGL